VRYELVPALPSDRDWLEALRRAVYQDLFFATWGAWDEVRHQRHLAECIELGEINIIELNGERAGIIQIFDTPDAVEIGEIQVEPERQNRGIGTRVLLDIISAARLVRKPVRLSVALKNDNALRLYTRLGFRQVGRSETHNFMEATP
jgi:ribosomal protein S18 acetylase RimI-like enzyme